MGRRIDESVWDQRRELLRRQESSGVSAAQFCRENDVKLWNFHAWKRRLNGDVGLDLPMQSEQKSERGDLRRRSFVQVPIQGLSEMNSGRSWIEVSSATGIVVRVPPNNLPALRLVLGTLAQENAHA